MKKPFILGIIPARGGSKRLPGKNVKLLNGKPLISYIIETALNSECFDDVIVSTDSKKIAGISKKYGANVPWLRPKKLAQDNSAANEVIKYEIKKYEIKNNVIVNIIVLMQATTPTTTTEDIQKVIELVEKSNYKTSMTIFRVYDRPEWCGIKSGKLFKNYFSLEDKNKMAKIDWYMPSGGVYASKRNYFFESESFYSDKCGYVEIPLERNTDIDTEMDFNFAEFLIKKKITKEKNI